MHSAGMMLLNLQATYADDSNEEYCIENCGDKQIIMYKNVGSNHRFPKCKVLVVYFCCEST